jgi:hypothetical protein
LQFAQKVLALTKAHSYKTDSNATNNNLEPFPQLASYARAKMQN